MGTPEEQYTESELRRMWDAWTVHGETTKTRILKEIKVDMDKVRELASKIDGSTTKAEGFMHSLANIFKFGAGESEKHYPSKKK
jgi:hypothetical protein